VIKCAYKVILRRVLPDTLCCGKAASTTYSESVHVLLVIQRKKRMRLVLFAILACPSIIHYLINGTICGEKDVQYKTYVLIFSTVLSGMFLISRRVQQHNTIKVHNCLCKTPIILIRF
jgi:hypothetical protein